MYLHKYNVHILIIRIYYPTNYSSMEHVVLQKSLFQRYFITFYNIFTRSDRISFPKN